MRRSIFRSIAMTAVLASWGSLSSSPAPLSAQTSQHCCAVFVSGSLWALCCGDRGCSTSGQSCSAW